MKLRINYKAVIVSLFGIFCLYFYFRLINPYLDIGGNSKLVSSEVFFRKVVYIRNERYSYWTNGIKNPKRILVMLPPSTATGDYFGRYALSVPNNVLIIAPDYPGRGLTDGINTFDTVPLMSYKVGLLIKAVVGEKRFDIVAPSFGGMIGTYLAKDNSLNIGRIILIATGEFFASDQKFMFKALFYPSTFSEKIRARYVNFLTGKNFINNLQNTDINDILEQWIMTIDYKIDTSRKSEIPATIVVFDRDNVVQPYSTQKLQEVFINNKVININLTHTSPSFFNLELLNIILGNI